MAKRQFCVPFHNGSMQPYVGYTLSDEEEKEYFNSGSIMSHTSSWYGGDEWRPNKPFECTLQYEGFSRGRSSAGFAFKDQDGHSYWMFMTDMDDLIRAGARPLEVRGTFEFVKRGQNYGIKFLEEKQ